MRDTILWLADSGAEGHLAVSIASLRRNAPNLWADSSKVIVDVGLSSTMLDFLANARSENVHVVPLAAIGVAATSSEPPGYLAMRTRIGVSVFLEGLADSGALPRTEHSLVCDADTVFSSEFSCPMPGPAADLMIMQEWDTHSGHERPMLLVRPSNFSQPLAEISLADIARDLDVPEDALRSMPTYNTGVFVFRVGRQFADAWLCEYERLIGIVDGRGRPVFSMYAAEQNAMSIAIYRKTIVHDILPRRFNQFPPRHPQEWPADTAIAHFISFGRNHTEERYRRWFEARALAQADKWLPPALLSDVDEPSKPRPRA